MAIGAMSVCNGIQIDVFVGKVALDNKTVLVNFIGVSDLYTLPRPERIPLLEFMLRRWGL